MDIIRKHTGTLICGFFCLFFLACGDNIEPGPTRQGEKPDPITRYDIRSIAGGAIITYDLPNSGDLRYVKAVFTLADGKERENKASVYQNSITIDGFPEAGEYPVKLVAVSAGDVESDPTVFNVAVLTPPYRNTLEQLAGEGKITPTFGGIRITFENETQAPLAIHVIAKDDQGEWQRAHDYYTQLAAGMVNVRGYPSQEREFGVYITDRWNNRSDTLKGVFRPFHEVMMDKSKFREYNLPTDTWQPHTNFFTPSVLWDGNDRAQVTVFHTTPGTGLPQHFTFDMGVKAQISRFLMFARLNHEYAFNHPKAFELWGSNNPASDGSWDSWTLVGTYTSFKPSGLPVGENTTDDLSYVRSGEEFDIEYQEEPYRYWRWRTLATWGGNTEVSLNELSFFGTVVE